MRASIRSAWRSKATVRSARRAPRTSAGGPSIPRRCSPAAARAPDSRACETYIREHRQNEFLDNLCRKLLAYALDRSLQLSDEPLIEQMQTRLAANGYRFTSLVETIVTSPQFLNKRNPDYPQTRTRNKER